MTRERWILYGLIAALGIVVILLWRGVIGNKGRNDSSNMREIEMKDKVIEVQAEMIDFLEDEVKHSRGADSAYIRAIRDNQPKIIINEQRLQDIPTRYRDISKDDLRKRATTY